MSQQELRALGNAPPAPRGGTPGARGQDGLWSEWRAFAGNVEGMTAWLNDGVAAVGTRLLPEHTAELLDKWRVEDAREAGVPLETLTVLAYVVRPGVAPFFKMRPMHPHARSKDTPTPLEKQLRDRYGAALDAQRERRRAQVLALREERRQY
jgi:hypothetical protein